MFKPGPLGMVGVMFDLCPNCGLSFLRESGYFLGAMYVSYGLGVFSVLPVAIIMAAVLNLPLWLVLVVSLLQTLISVPLFLRLSRSIWMYLDQSIDPR